MKRSRLISIETESDSNTFWSWYSTQELPKQTNTISAHTYTQHEAGGGGGMFAAVCKFFVATILLWKKTIYVYTHKCIWYDNYLI